MSNFLKLQSVNRNLDYLLVIKRAFSLNQKMGKKPIKNLPILKMRRRKTIAFQRKKKNHSP